MNNVIVAFIMLLGYVVVVADAITDASVNRYAEWWAWHAAKWCRYYVPFVIIISLMLYAKLISINKLTILGLIAYATIGWILWQVFYVANPLGKSWSADKD